MSQGSWGGGGGGGGGGGWGGGGGGGYGPPGGGAPPGGGGYGGPPGGGGYGGPPGGGGYGGPPGGGGYGGPPGGGGYGGPPGGGGYGGPPGGGYGQPPGYQQQQQPGGFAPPPAGYPPGYQPPTGGVVAWEDQSLGLFSRWWGTVKEVLFNPRGFSAASATSDNAWPAVTFAITNGAFLGIVEGAFAAILYLLIGGFGAMASIAGGGKGGGPAAGVFAVLGTIGVFVGFLIPIFHIAVGLILPWIVGGIEHIGLSIFGGSSRPYSSSVRNAAFAHAALLWQPIPMVGGLAMLIHWFVCSIIGLDETHHSGLGKAVGAVLCVFVVGCICCCGPYGGLIGLGASAAPHHR